MRQRQPDAIELDEELDLEIIGSDTIKLVKICQEKAELADREKQQVASPKQGYLYKNDNTAHDDIRISSMKNISKNQKKRIQSQKNLCLR